MTDTPDRPDREPEQPPRQDVAGQPDLGPPGYGQPGYGQSGYVAPAGYGQPPVYGPDMPMPGAVPLRPVGAGAILGGALGYIRANPGLVFGVTAVGAAISLVAQVVMQLAIDSFDLYFTRTVAVAVVFVVWAVPYGLLFVALGRAVLGRRIGFGDAWRTVAPRLPGLIGLSLLIGLIIAALTMVAAFALFVALWASAVGPASVLGVGLVVTLVAVLIATWLAVLWSLAAPAYVLEDIGVIAALSRSRHLVRGAWWRIFGIMLLAGLSSAVVFLVFWGVFGVLSDGELTAIGSIIASTLTVPFVAGVMGLLYVDQRVRRERYGVELAGVAAA
jgi:hypothetical protein